MCFVSMLSCFQSVTTKENTTGLKRRQTLVVLRLATRRDAEKTAFE